MDRRTFLRLGIGTWLQMAGDRDALAAGVDGPRRTARVVKRLRAVSMERREKLSLNPGLESPSALNAYIPEIDEIELDNSLSRARPGETLRLIAWNTERGRHWRGGVRLVREHPALKDPDIIFLGEMDLGMARSANEHTTREMARALGMNYAYGVEFLEFTGGEEQERARYPGRNERGYHGNAILSRFPLRHLRMIRFPGIEKWYSDYQKRLGGRMALFASVELHGKPFTLVSTHLESAREDVAQRSGQMRTILQELAAASSGIPVLMGGDLNATLEEPLFDELRRERFLIEECNEMSTGTSQRLVDGRVELTSRYIDYLCVRGVEVVRDANSPRVVPAVYPPVPTGLMLGDHAIVTARFRLEGS